MGQERDFWRKHLLEFKKSFDLSPELPREAAFELQHSLNHILVGYRHSNRAKELDKALGHLKRAHLDYLKILIFKVHRELAKLQGLKEAQTRAVFSRMLMRSRVKELCAVGTDHQTTIDSFRLLLERHKHFLPSSTGRPVHVPADAAMRGATAQNNYLFLPEEEELLWEWAQLELLLTSFTGQRIYDIVFNMIDSYLRAEDFANSLKVQVATLKAMLTEWAFSLDFDSQLQLNLSKYPEWADIEDALEKIQMGDDSAGAIIVEQIESIFGEVLSFLDISREPLKPKPGR